MSTVLESKEAAILITALRNEEAVLTKAARELEQAQQEVERVEGRCQKLRQIASLIEEL